MRVPTRGNITVGVLTLAGLVIRSMLAAHGGLWRDEGLFLFVARSESLGAMMDFLRYHESHPPLFYLLMRGWLNISGDTDAAALIPPIVFGAALVPAIFAVGSSLFSRRVGLLAALLATLSPALAEQSAVARPYSLLPLLALVSTYMLIRGIETGRRRAWLSYSLATLAMIYTHNWALLFLIGQWVAVGVLVLRPITRGRKAITREWVSSQLLIAAGYLVWVPSFIYQVRHAGQGASLLDVRAEPFLALMLAVRQLADTSILANVRPLIGFEKTLISSLIAVLMLLLVADQFLRARKQRRRRHGDDRNGTGIDTNFRTTIIVLLVSPLTAWLTALILSPRSDLMVSRCMVMLAPMLLLALAYWFERPRRGEILYVSRAAAAAFFAIYVVVLFSMMKTQKSNARELALTVAERTRAGDLLVIVPEWLASSFNRYYAPKVEQMDFPSMGREGAVDFSDVLARLRDPAAAEHAWARITDARMAGRRVWLISQRNTMDDSTASATPRLLRSKNYVIVAIARAAQMRALLDSLYGSPDTTAVTGSPPSRYENLRAFLYVPPSK